MKKILLFMALSLILILTSIGCSKPKVDDGSIELTVMHFMTEAAIGIDPKATVIHKLFDKYEKENTNVKLNMTAMGHDDYQIKIQSLAAADDLPDVFIIKGPWTKTFVDNELVSDLTADLENYEFKDTYYDKIFGSITMDGKIYGTPIEGNAYTCYVYYNKRMWKEAGYDEFPKTWDEIFEANQYFKSKKIPAIGLGNRDKWPYNSCIISTLGDRFTGSEWTQSLIKNEGAKFTDEDFIKVLEMTKKFGEENLFNADYNSINNNQTQSLFLTEKYAATIEGYWFMGPINRDITNEITKHMATNIGLASLPSPSGNNLKGNPMASSGGAGWFFAINSKLEGKKREKAIELIFELGGKNLSDGIAEFGEPGPNKSEIDISKFNPIRQNYLTLTDEYETIPVYDVWLQPALIQIMNNNFQEILNGTKTPEDAAIDMQKSYDEAYNN